MKLADFPFISKHEASKLLGVSVTTLNRWRKDPSKEWHQETHYTQRDSGEWEYNQTLLEKWRDRQIRMATSTPYKSFSRRSKPASGKESAAFSLAAVAVPLHSQRTGYRLYAPSCPSFLPLLRGTSPDRADDCALYAEWCKACGNPTLDWLKLASRHGF